jgi:hypothetical protein
MNSKIKITLLLVFLINTLEKNNFLFESSDNYIIQNKGEEIANYAFRGYDCDNFWTRDTLCYYGVQPYIVECHWRSGIYNFPSYYNDMLKGGIKVPVNDIKNGDLILFKEGTFGLKESYGIYKDGFIYYKTTIENARRSEIDNLKNYIEGIRRYW